MDRFNLLAAFCFWAVLGPSANAFYTSYYNSNPIALTIPKEDKGYDQFSTCFYVNLKSSVPITQQIPVLSYLAGDEKTAEIVFQLESERQMSSLFIGGGENGAHFPMTPSPNQWTHICLTWDSSLGLVNAYADGESVGMANDIQTGYQIPGQGTWNVGMSQPDMGQITQLHFWDRILSDEEVQQALQCSLSGNVLSWDSYITSSEGLIEPISSEFLPYPCELIEESTCEEHPTSSPLDSEDLDYVWDAYKVEGVFNKRLPHQRNTSFCAWFYIEEDAEIDPIGIYSTDDMEFGIFVFDDATLGLKIGGSDYYDKKIIPNLNIEYYMWNHYCFTWSGHDGQVQVFVNGELKHVLKYFMDEYAIPAGGKIWITQLQYDNADPSDPTYGFSLKITDVNWWNRVITEEEVSQVFSCSGSIPGNLFSWNDDTFDFYEVCLGPVTSSFLDDTRRLVTSRASCTVSADQVNWFSGVTDFSFCNWLFVSEAGNVDSYMPIIGNDGIADDGDYFTLMIIENGIEFSYGDESGYFGYDRERWDHVCLAFDSTSGELSFYLNGKFRNSGTSSTQAGEDVATSYIQISQFQTEGVDNNESPDYSVKVTAVNVWDYAITEDTAYAAYCGEARGNLVNDDTEFGDPYCYEDYIAE